MSTFVGLVLVLSPLQAASARDADRPLVEDRIFDANFVNSQGSSEQEIGIGTGPFSIHEADLRFVWFETPEYRVVVDRTEGGRWVRFVPTMFRVEIRTTDVPRPAFGTGVVLGVPVRVDTDCRVVFEMWFKGSLDRMDLVQDRANVSKVDASCPGGSGTLTTGIRWQVDVAATFIDIPLDATDGLLQPWTVLDPWLNVSSRVACGQNPVHECRGAYIDEASPLSRPYVIGEDLPADIDCSREPWRHPLCEEQ